MKAVLVSVAVLVLVNAPCAAAQGQKQDQSKSKASASGRADASSQSSVKSGSRDLTLDSGSQIEAEMSSALDLSKAQRGQAFLMKTTRPIKRDGHEVVSRGSTISGHIQQITQAKNTTEATLVFDMITDRKTGATGTLQAVVRAVTDSKGVAANRAADDMSMSPMPSAGATGQGASQSSGRSGGLVGGVVNTVGGVTGQVGSTVDSTTRATVGADSGLSRSTRDLAPGAIQIVTNTTANATSSSTLALPGKKTNIEGGTRFVLETTSALAITKKAEK